MKERRKERRWRYQTPVLIQPQRGRRWYNGSMFNISRKGLYIETEFNGHCGQQISIFVEAPPQANGPILHRARIRWANEMAEAVVLYPYGCGVETDMTVDYSLDRTSLPIKPRSGNDRRSGRDRRRGPACRRKDFLVGSR